MRIIEKLDIISRRSEICKSHSPKTTFNFVPVYLHPYFNSLYLFLYVLLNKWLLYGSKFHCMLYSENTLVCFELILDVIQCLPRKLRVSLLPCSIFWVNMQYLYYYDNVNIFTEYISF